MEGRRRLLNEGHVLALREIVTEHPGATLEAAARVLEGRCGVKVCSMAVRRALYGAVIVRIKTTRRAVSCGSSRSSPKRYGYTQLHRREHTGRDYSCCHTDAEWALVADLFEHSAGSRALQATYGLDVQAVRRPGNGNAYVFHNARSAQPGDVVPKGFRPCPCAGLSSAHMLGPSEAAAWTGQIRLGSLPVQTLGTTSLVQPMGKRGGRSPTANHQPSGIARILRSTPEPVQPGDRPPPVGTRQRLKGRGVHTSILGAIV